MSRRGAGDTLDSVTAQRQHFDELLDGQGDWTPIGVRLDVDGALASAVLDLARQRRWKLINLAKFRNHLPASIDVRGVLDGSDYKDAVTVDIVERRIPLVRIQRTAYLDDGALPVVGLDMAATGRMALDHFAQRDFKHVAYFGNDPWGSFLPAYEAFADAAGRRGIRCHLRQFHTDQITQRSESGGVDRWRARQDIFGEWLADLPTPLGLFAYSDYAADRFCQWIIDAQRRVPEDIAVLGTGNRSFVCQCAAVPISSMAVDDDRIAAAAVGLLGDLIEGRHRDRRSDCIQPVGVVTRKSTDVLAVSNPNVVAALRYIWDHITEDLSVDQIAERVGVSRRTLERAFKAELGRGINQELQRRRMDRARDLVVQTDLRIADIAAALGFNSHTYFGQMFRAAYGTSPARYRRRGRAG